MLPSQRRLKRPRDFGTTVKHGSRAAAKTVVVHVRHPHEQDPPEETRVGFVVSKKVGNAVHRNRVKRRLRHFAAQLDAPITTDVVVRALPAAATEPERVHADLTDAWQRAFRKVSP